MCNTCSVISSLRDLKQTCWQTGNMNFQNGTNCALQKLLTAVLLPLLRNCGHFYRCNMRFLKASLAQNCRFRWLECFPYAGVEKLFKLSLEVLSLVTFKHHEVGSNPRRGERGEALGSSTSLLDRRRGVFFQEVVTTKKSPLSLRSCSSLHWES